METWELEARVSIRDIVCRYHTNGDSGRFDAMMSLFAHDAVMEIRAGELDRRFEGLEAIRGLLTGARGGAAKLPATSETPATLRVAAHHHNTTHQVEFDSPTQARGYSYFMVLMPPHGLDHWGTYHDRYEHRDGRWLFTYRRVVTLGHLTDQFSR